jgi:cell wall-associated NlpC family hydrolase
MRDRLIAAALATAQEAAGKPYTPGGATPAGFDCSGFVTYVYRQVFPGYVHLNTDGIAASPLFAVAEAPQPGDLIFFPRGPNPYDRETYPNHVAIVLDGESWIGSQSSTGVAKVLLTNPWWSPRVRHYLQYAALAR